MRLPPLQPPLVWHSYLAAWLLGLCAAIWLIPSICCLCILFGVDRRLWSWPRLSTSIVVAALAFGILTLLISPPAPPKWLANLSPKSHITLCGSISKVQGLTDQRIRIILQKVAPPEHEDAVLPGSLAWTWDKPTSMPQVGQQACITRRVRPVHAFANDGLADIALRWRAHGIFWQIWSQGNTGNPAFSELGTSLQDQARSRLHENFVQSLLKTSGQSTPSQAQAILLALLFGDKFFLTQDSVNLFTDGSLAHSLALSGQHLAIAGFAGLLFIFCIAQIYPALYFCLPRIVWILWASIPPAVAYLWLGNAPPSLLRAACMLVFAALYQQLCKSGTLLDFLALTLAGIVLLWPSGILDTGLQLSASCLFAIGLTVPLFRKYHVANLFGSSFLARCANGLAGIFCISLILQIALIPLTLLLFHTVGTWFPLNILWLPMLGLIVLPFAMLGLLSSYFDMQILAQIAVSIATTPCEWILSILTFLKNNNLFQEGVFVRPFWTSLPAWVCLLIALAMHFAGDNYRNQLAKHRLAIMGLLFSLVGPILQLREINTQKIELTMFDVGQGQSLGLRAPGPVQFVIDGGGTYSTRFDIGKDIILPALAYNRFPKIDGIIATHPDMDHIGGLFAIASRTRPNLIFDNGVDGTNSIASKWQMLMEHMQHAHLGAGDVIKLGDPDLNLRLHVLHPPHKNAQDSSTQWKDNDASLVLRLTSHGQGLLLIPGDAGRDVLKHLIQTGNNLEAQVLVASHHGSDKNFLPEFYEAVNPRVVLASCGFQNRFGFPGKKLSAWLASRNVAFYHTDTMGSLTATWCPEGTMQIHASRVGLLGESKEQRTTITK